MSRITAALLAFAALTTTGCAAMGTKRSPGAQIQRTAEPEPTVDNGAAALDGRQELGQR